MAKDVSASTSKQRIYRALRHSIILGDCRPGERLDIDELARRHRTSVTPIRDALHMLNQEGLVAIRPRAGYFVARITLKELRDLLDLRQILELAAVEGAAQRITGDALAGLRGVHQGYTGDDEDSYDRYTDENRRFHVLLAEAAGNHELAGLLGRVHDRLARFMVLRHGGLVQHETHARIIAAVEAHDVAAARQAMLDEIGETRDTILERVMREESANWQLDA